ncbi:MAG: hypothetical protein JRI71_00875 [Deltaproteobacteria bacterium]|nr:hypothetical protein [Deltaproteobacteria bacterium]MBW2309853.1 hypothetical protein [Deltaproteobacteria bacterium]
MNWQGHGERATQTERNRTGAAYKRGFACRCRHPEMEMRSEAGADHRNADRFMDFPRYITGVEVAALIRELDKGLYRFSLRSNDSINVADIASHFSEGGHPRAAAFTRQGSLESVKHEFLGTAVLLRSARSRNPSLVIHEYRDQRITGTEPRVVDNRWYHAR